MDTVVGCKSLLYNPFILVDIIGRDLIMEKLKCLALAILAGIMIGIGGVVYLSVENIVIGSLLFSIGLFFVLCFELNLFTGKIGYLFNNPISYTLDIIIIWLGNFIGIVFTGILIKLTRIYPIIYDRVHEISAIKLSDDIFSILILSTFCGILMYVAVDGYKTLKGSAERVSAVVLPISVFIICGFEHCIANMLYFTLANAWNINTFIYILVMTLGNSIGAILFSRIIALSSMTKQKKIQ